MQESRDSLPDNPLRNLTEAQFMALGGNAVVYVKHVKGETVADVLPDADLGDGADDYHIVVSADGQPLMVADSEEAVEDWLSNRNFGIVTLH